MDDSTEVSGELQYVVEARVDQVRAPELNGYQGQKLEDDATMRRSCEEFVVNSVKS